MEAADKMSTAPVKGLMLSMGIPIILSMVLQAVYNIVDSAFVANMPENGEAALNALTLAFPFQMLMVAVGIGTGVGVNALLSKSLGQGDRERAGMAAGNGVFLGAVIYIMFMLFGIFGVRAYIGSQTSNALISAMAEEYLRICCIFSMGIVFFSVYEKLLQATGHSVCSTIAQVSGALANIILDPIMIYGLFGFPRLGAVGAAWATVAGQILSFVIALVFHLKLNRAVPHGLKYMRPSFSVIKAIYAIGLPAIIAQALMSLMTYGLNVILGGVSEAMVTAYGLYYKIQQFVLFAAFGLRDAITPIVSYSHGMGSRERIRDGVKYGIGFTLAIMAAGLLAIELLAVPFAGLFGLSGETKGLCITAMRVVSISFIFAGVNIALQGIFQALEGGLQSLLVSLCRQLIFIFPLVWAFAELAKKSPALTPLIWTSFPIAELLSMAVALLLYKGVRDKSIKM